MEPTTSATKGTIAFVNVASQTLYLGFTVAQDPQFSEKDLIQLLFDVNNNQQIDAGDFYLLIRVGPKLPTPGPLQSGTSCHFAVTGIQAFQNNGTWQPMSITVGTLTGQIEAQAAYDYAGPPDDNEVGAWNVEIRVPLVGAGFSLPNSFGFGAYVYVDFNAGSPNAQTGQVLRWPTTLPPKNMGEVNLTFYPVNGNTLASADLKGSCYNVTLYHQNMVTWSINGSSQTTNPNDRKIHREGGNTFLVQFYYSGPGNGHDPVPNTGAGQVMLNLHPYFVGTGGAAYSWSVWRTPDEAVALTNTVYRATFGDPVTPYPQGVNFLCATMELQNFPHNDDPTDDWQNVNYNYVHTSNYTQIIDIGVDTLPGLRGGDTTTLFLQIVDANDPSSKHGALTPHPASWAQLASQGSAHWFVTAGALGLIAVVLRRRRRIAGVSITLGIVAFILACRPQPGSGGGVQGGRWQVDNANELRIRPVPNEPGWYSMPARIGQHQKLNLSFTGHPLPYQTVTQSLPMSDSTGHPNIWRVPVRAGQIASIIAFGTVDLDGDGPEVPTDAAGFVRHSRPRLSAALVDTSQHYLLHAGRYLPAQFAGALIGSFDGFRTSFFIGTDAAFVVPQGAEMLSMAINGTQADYGRAKGSLIVKFIVNPPITVPTSIRAGYNTPFDQPNFLALWEVLTSTSLYTYYEVPLRDRNNQLVSRTRRSLGAAHMIIYESQ